MTTKSTKYPHITARLTGRDGNAFAILGVIISALKSGGVSTAEQDTFRNEATSGDYDHLLQTAMRWVNVE